MEFLFPVGLFIGVAIWTLFVIVAPFTLWGIWFLATKAARAITHIWRCIPRHRVIP